MRRCYSLTMMLAVGFTALAQVQARKPLWESPAEDRAGDRRVSSLAFSPDGKLLASGFSQHITGGGNIIVIGGPLVNEITVWETATGKDRFRLAPDFARKIAPDRHVFGPSEGWDHTVNALAFSPDGKLLASAATDGLVRLWDVTTGKELATFGNAGEGRCVAFSPDGSLLAFGGGYRGLGGGGFTGGGGFGHKGERVVQPQPVTAPVVVVNLATRKEVAQLTCPADAVSAVGFSPDGKLLATASSDQTVRLWDVTTKRTTVEIPDRALPALTPAFSPDGNLLVVANPKKPHQRELWEVAPGQRLLTVTSRLDLRGIDTKGVTACALSADGKLCATGGGGLRVRLWDLPR